MKASLITARDSSGKAESWGYWRDKIWYLRAPDGYVRALEPTWRDSVPRIRTILENHGLAANVS